MSNLPFIPQAFPLAGYLAQQNEIAAAAARVLAGGRYILGEEVEQFEKEFAAFLGAGGAVGVASGTDAVELALRALGIGPGDAVITVSHTAVATVAAIERAGALPMLVDVDPQTYAIDPGCIKDALDSGAAPGRVRAILPVHLYGHPAPMEPLMELARRHGLFVVEDCAQSHGAKLAGRTTGTFGELSAFSFYPTKNLGAFGDGGLVAGSDPALLDRVRSLREYGWKERYVSSVPGVNSRLDELQAAMLRVRLTRLAAENARRGEIAARYTAGLAGAPITLPTVAAGAAPVWHQYVIECDDRDALRQRLEQAGIGTGVHYPMPVHLQPAYRGRVCCAGPLPCTERAAGRIVSLPMSPHLADAEIDRVIAAIRSALKAGGGPTAGSRTP